MTNRTRALLLTVSLAFLANCWPSVAQTDADTDNSLKIGISQLEPFIFCGGKDNNTGFSIDLWEAVVGRHPYGYEYVVCKGVQDKLKKLESGDIDVAIGGISITRERESKVDFTHSFFHTGLGIMSRTGRVEFFRTALRLLFSKNKLIIIVSFILLVVISGHLMWLAEKGEDMFNDKYFPGVFEGMYWAIVTASTVGYGDKAPVKWKGRALAGIVIIISLPMFAIFTAELASTFTMLRFKTVIEKPEDLANRTVAVVKGSTSADSVTHYHCIPRYYPDIRSAIDALKLGQVDAVVYDAPILQYLAAKDAGLVVSDELFAPQYLAFAVKKDSKLRKELNLTLLELYKSGKIQTLKSKWFGNLKF